MSKFNEAREFDSIEDAKNWLDSYCIDSQPESAVHRLYRHGLPGFRTQDQLDDYIYTNQVIAGALS